MNLNDYQINQIIKQSRMKINYRKILQKNVKLYIFLLFCLFILSKVITFSTPIFLSAFVPIMIGMSTEIITKKVIRKNANKKIGILANHLKSKGIIVSRMKLKKAQLGTMTPNTILEAGTIIKEIEDIAVFSDYQKELKALRQVRYELITIAPEYKNQYEYGNYTEIVENSEESKRLYKKLVEK